MFYNKESKTSSYILGCFIVFVIICLNALGQYFQKQQVVTLVLLPALFAIAFIKDDKSYNLCKTEFFAFILIFLTSITTAFYYVNYDAFIRNLSLLFGSILATYIVIGLNKKYDNMFYFHIGYILSIILLVIIMYINGNINFSNFASVVDFRDRFMLNANAYSYYSLFANFSLFYLYLKYKNNLLAILLLVLPIFFLIIAFTTQSRSGLYLIILINVFFWLFINKSNNNTPIKKILIRFSLFIIFITITLKFVEIYQGSRIQGRISTYSNKVDSREVLIYDGLNIFSENIIFGVGLGQFPFYNNYGLFSHNSYVEILAEQGIIGGILLLILFGVPLYRSYKLLLLDKKNEFLKCNLFFFVIFIIYNNVYVFYKFPFSMLYFFMILTLQNKVYKETFEKNLKIKHKELQNVT
ncbi:MULTISPECIES: O-antigen ligase family protein [Cellulophaga]|uniref:O-antigen ligase family protein n=1 Tax=Cellulophaga TaxID=104264 RepID=UPI000409D96D|nr:MULTISPECIES: O-antigen ligase family protein [Cellulophaga]AIY13939.1 hypothetical protein M667_12375 [Cellulophaga baltica NN016038]KGK29137.1 hypothetical protein EL45_17970 [Cellulophaga sp. E6(2014)]